MYRLQLASFNAVNDVVVVVVGHRCPSSSLLVCGFVSSSKFDGVVELWIAVVLLDEVLLALLLKKGWELMATLMCLLLSSLLLLWSLLLLVATLRCCGVG